VRRLGVTPRFDHALGMIPSWAKDATAGSRMINARVETAAEKPAFQDALSRRRCLVPADGFYEWNRFGRDRQPYCFEGEGRKPFAFAGLWDRWQMPGGIALETFTILTTTPNSLLSDVRDRMPVILPPENYDLWLNPQLRNVERIQPLLKPYDANQMRRYAVSTRINNVGNDDRQCSEPVTVSPAKQYEMF